VSKEREISLGGSNERLKKGIYEASAKIFQDTENLALCINITNTKIDKVVVSEWFNIEILNHDEKTENWLALVVARNMLTSIIAGRRGKRDEVQEGWKKLMEALGVDK